MYGKLIAGIASGLLAAAILAAGAQAERPDDRAGMLGVGAASRVVIPDAVDRAVLDEAPVRPDDRGGLHGAGIVPSAGPSSTPGVTGTEFRWNDAALGAGAALGFVLLGAAVLVTVRQRRRVIMP